MQLNSKPKKTNNNNLRDKEQADEKLQGGLIKQWAHSQNDCRLTTANAAAALQRLHSKKDMNNAESGLECCTTSYVLDGYFLHTIIF